ARLTSTSPAGSHRPESKGAGRHVQGWVAPSAKSPQQALRCLVGDILARGSTPRDGSMQVEALALQEVKLLTPKIFRDERGFFSETYNQKALTAAGIDRIFVQDNQSLSRVKGVLRGLHFQIAPHPQGKLVRVTRGAIFDV